MPNDTLDEIEARWKDCEQDEFTDLDPAEQALWVAIEDLHALIEMVRARDRVVDTARKVVPLYKGCRVHEYEIELWRAVDALDTPSAQEQKR